MTKKIYVGNTDDLLKNGRKFTAGIIKDSIADEGVVNFLIIIGSCDLEFGYTDLVSGDFLGQIYENPTITDNGTEISIKNLNRSVSDIDGCTIYDGPTASDNGTLLAEAKIPGGSSVFTRSGASSQSSWILKANTSYLIKNQNLSGTTGFITKKWNWNKC